MVYQNLRHAHLLEVGLTQILGNHNFLNIFPAGQIQNIFHDKHIPQRNSLKLIEFETHYIKSNPPLLFRQQSMQWSYNMVHSHFTLCLRARDYIKHRLSQHPWYGLWMSVKGPHIQGHGRNVRGEPVFSVMAAGWFCEKSG